MELCVSYILSSCDLQTYLDELTMVYILKEDKNRTVKERHYHNVYFLKYLSLSGGMELYNNNALENLSFHLLFMRLFHVHANIFAVKFLDANCTDPHSCVCACVCL